NNALIDTVELVVFYAIPVMGPGQRPSDKSQFVSKLFFRRPSLLVIIVIRIIIFGRIIWSEEIFRIEIFKKFSKFFDTFFWDLWLDFRWLNIKFSCNATFSQVYPGRFQHVFCGVDSDAGKQCCSYGI